MTTQPPPLRVPFGARGSRTSGHGGWVCGAMAERMDPAAGAVRVRLSVLPPLDVDLLLVPTTLPHGAEGLRLAGGPTTVAEAMVVTDEPLPLTAGEAGLPDPLAAGGSGPQDHDHPAPECFGCGPARGPGDGLRLRTGPVPGVEATSGAATGGAATTATAWVPHPAFDAGDGAVGLPVLWTALDCPGRWSVLTAGAAPGSGLLLGTMTAAVRRRPQVGETCVILGRADPCATDDDGRTVTARTTLLGADGAVLATAEQRWVRLT